MSNKIAPRTVLKQRIVVEFDKKTLLNKKGEPWQKCLYISNHLLKRYKHQLTHVQMRMPDSYSLLICRRRLCTRMVGKKEIYI